MKRWLYVAGAIALLAISAKSCVDASSERRKNERSIAKADSATKFADSVKIENANRDARIRQLQQAALDDDREADRLRAQAQASAAAAARLSERDAALRDSLRKAQTASDSISLYQQQVSSLEGQLEAWKRTADSALAADAKRQASVDSLLRGAIVADSSLRASEAANRQQAAAIASLRQRVERAEAPCRILWAKCQSRTTIAIEAAIISAAGTAFLIRRSQRE